MRMRNLISSYVVIAELILIGSLAYAIPPQHESDSPQGLPFDYIERKDARVLLKMPYDTIIRGERLRVLYIGIQNFSNSPIKLLKNSAELDVFQTYCQARSGPGHENLIKRENIPVWDKFEAETNGLAYENILNGTFKFIDRIMFGMGAPEGTREIRVGFLVGPNEWIFSEWEPLRRIEGVHLQNGEVIKTVMHRMFREPAEIRLINILGDNYLFYRNIRFARVPDGASPRIDWDETTLHITVHFDGIDLPPFLYNASQYLPIRWHPETAPHMLVAEQMMAELNRARDALVLAPEPQNFVNPSASDDKPIPGPSKRPNALAVPFETQEKASTNPEAKPPPARKNLPVLLAFFLLAGIAALVLNRKKRS